MSAVLNFTDTRSSRNDCDTSKAAAKAAASDKAARERIAITAAVKAAPGGLTAREVDSITGIGWHEVSRRISECGLTKTSESRDGCRVWSAGA